MIEECIKSKLHPVKVSLEVDTKKWEVRGSKPFLYERAAVTGKAWLLVADCYGYQELLVAILRS